ncbi:MAG: hypothetical protein GXP27_22490 [Planctomycetes bacterium]|nr:hypothetical protein [Planctomycetota bacterium]
MNGRNAFVGILGGLLAVMLLGPLAAAAQVAQNPEPSGSGEGNGQQSAGSVESNVPLSTRQEAIAIRFRRFENTLLQLAEYLRKTDPDRAELLIRAIGESQEKKIQHQMTTIVSLLARGQFGDAIDRQGDLVKSLQALLELLQSEDRRSALEAERERLKKLLKEVSRLIGQEKDARATNERGEATDRAAGKQEKVAERTGQLLDEIKQHDGAGKNQPGTEGQSSSDTDRSSQSQSGESDQSKSDQSGSGDSKSPSDAPSSDQTKTPQQGQPSDGAEPNPPSGDQDSQDAKPSESSGGQSPSSQAQPSPSQTPSPGDTPKTPGREQLEQAYQQMKQALEKLRKQQREKASDHQDEAIRKLVEAKDKLEEILRQLREEERGILLTALEARFRKMLAMQQLVYHKTVELNAVPEADRSVSHRERARKLSFDENAIGLEADKALALLREEGSSVAFPQAVEDLRQDIDTVTRRLERAQVGALTQSIEQDIIDALEEILDALEKELQKLEEKQQQQQEAQQPQDGEPPLVDLLSELKMLRTLQVRINRRTKRLGNLIEGNQATDPDIVQQLQELAERQARVQQATYDLVTGRNR